MAHPGRTACALLAGARPRPSLCARLLANPQSPDFESLAAICRPGEHFYCASWTGAAPSGWNIEFESTVFQMVWDAGMPPPSAGFDPVRFEAVHAQQALELATLTEPGPFGLRTIERGDFFGVFEGPRLVAVAGERMHAGHLREISSVCAHPKFQGRGLARRLMVHLIRRQLRRGERPFLHVMRENAAARGLYEKLGFRDCAEVTVRVVSLK